MLLMIADSYYYWIFKFRYRSLKPEKTVLKYIYNIFFSKVLRNCANDKTNRLKELFAHIYQRSYPRIKRKKNLHIFFL